MTLTSTYVDRDSRQQLDLGNLRKQLNADRIPEVWLAIGQSNMAGQFQVSTVFADGKDLQYPGFEIVDNDGAVMPPLHPHHRANAEENTAFVTNNAQGGSMGSEFCRLRAGHGGGQRVIMCGGAVGGTNLVGNEAVGAVHRGYWYGPNTTSQPLSAGGELYQDTLARMTALINAENVWFRGILWHQGESDAIALGKGTVGVSKALYKEGFVNMVEGLKDNLPDDYYGDHSDLIVIVGQLGEALRVNGYTFGVGTAASNFQTIDEAHQELCRDNRGYYFVSSDGLDLVDEGSGNIIHFGTDEVREMGRRMFAASISAQADMQYNQAATPPFQEFSSGKGYNAGDIAVEAGRAYRSSEDQDAGSFDVSKWGSVDSAAYVKSSFALTTAFPSGAVAGDTYPILCTAGTVVDGVTFNTGDLLVALVDAPSTSTYSGNWLQLPSFNWASSGYSLAGGAPATPGLSVDLPDVDLLIEWKKNAAGVNDITALTFETDYLVRDDGSGNTRESRMYMINGFDYTGAIGAQVENQFAQFGGFRGTSASTGTESNPSDSVALGAYFRPSETETFSGDGSTTAFVLSDMFFPATAANTSVNNGGDAVRIYVDGVQLRKGSDYTVNLALGPPYTVTFNSAPASGTDNIEVRYTWHQCRGETFDGKTGWAGWFRSSPLLAQLQVVTTELAYGIRATASEMDSANKEDQTLVRGRDLTVVESRRGTGGISKATFDREGTITFGVNPSGQTPSDRFLIDDDGIEVEGNEKRLVLASADGSRVAITVSNAGDLVLEDL